MVEVLVYSLLIINAIVMVWFCIKFNDIEPSSKKKPKTITEVYKLNENGKVTEVKITTKED